MFQAANASSELSQSTIKVRNTNIDDQLRKKNLHSINVRGDGNCFFRAISVFLYSNENHHADLRRAVAESIMLSSSHDSISTEDATACRLRAEYIRQDGNWVGEDIIPVAAEYLKRDIHVFVAFANISPLVYSSSSSVLPPVVLAFYEPGHYKSVLLSTRQNDDAGHISDLSESMKNNLQTSSSCDSYACSGCIPMLCETGQYQSSPSNCRISLCPDSKHLN